MPAVLENLYNFVAGNEDTTQLNIEDGPNGIYPQNGEQDGSHSESDQELTNGFSGHERRSQFIRRRFRTIRGHGRRKEYNFKLFQEQRGFRPKEQTEVNVNSTMARKFSNVE